MQHSVCFHFHIFFSKSLLYGVKGTDPQLPESGWGCGEIGEFTEPFYILIVVGVTQSDTIFQNLGNSIRKKINVPVNKLYLTKKMKKKNTEILKL